MARSFRSFGFEAERWARRLTLDIDGVAVDPSDPVRGLEAAVTARMERGPQAIAVFIDEPRATVAAVLGASILAQHAHIDVRRSALSQLAAGTLKIDDGRSSGDVALVQPHVMKTLRHLHDLADVLVVRSWAERARLARLFGATRPSVRRIAPLDPDVPPPGDGSSERSTIVIWAPKRPAAEAAVFAFPFHEMDIPVVVVSAGGEPVSLRNVRYVDSGTRAAAATLETALVIVDAEFSDPGVALALAKHGVPLAVTSSSGAAEFLDPVYVYDPWNWSLLHHAGSAALGGAPPRIAVAEQPSVELPEPSIGPNPPLVSVVMPTYNRRGILARTLEVWSRQRYPNYEIVLVNDGGEPVDDIAGRYPRVRLIEVEQNAGHPATVHRGVLEARGEYLAIVDDDDEYAPDHIQQLVAALERTRASVAHTNVVIRHERGSGTDARIIGYSLPWNQPMDRTIVLVQGILPLQGLMLRRSAYGEPCWFDPALPVGRDYAMVLELALRYDFIHVDTTSAMYCVRSHDDSSMRRELRGKEAESLRMIYARHPTPDRAGVTEQREKVVAFNEHTGSDQFLEPAMRLPE